jgi:hypothetical protein
MKKIHLLYFSFLFISYASKAQYINEDYKITYKLKLQGVYSEQQAKSSSIELVKIFDSNHQLFNSSDSIITIRSAFNCDESRLIQRLEDYGYPVLFFKKTMDDISTEFKKMEE